MLSIATRISAGPLSRCQSTSRLPSTSSTWIGNTSGQRIKPQLLGVLDDRSRLCCHAQWYLEEECEALVHGVAKDRGSSAERTLSRLRERAG